MSENVLSEEMSESISNDTIEEVITTNDEAVDTQNAAESMTESSDIYSDESEQNIDGDGMAEEVAEETALEEVAEETASGETALEDEEGHGGCDECVPEPYTEPQTEEIYDVKAVTKPVSVPTHYVHVASDEDEPLSGIFCRCGFGAVIHSPSTDITTLYDSIHGSDIVVILESSDVFAGNKNMAYQVREALACKREVVIVSTRESTEFARKFENEEHVTLIKGNSLSDIFHLLFVQKLCKMPELFSDELCVRDRYGDVVHHAIDAWRGVAASEKFIAEAYMSGEVLPRLYNQAVFWLTRATAHGSIKSIVSLGDCYFYGNGCPENKRKAYELYCDAARQNSPEGFFRRGVCAFGGKGCEQDLDEAYFCFTSALSFRHDYPDAEFYLAQCYYNGFGVEESYSEAKSHYLKSAKGNYTPALIELGNLFSESTGDDRNLTLAFEYYSRAAANGSLEGLYKKGLALSTGDGCQKDPSAAYECFCRGAREKDMSCICSLGMCYEFGIGCECDYKKAFECYRRAADGGNPSAMNNLGGCYYYGHGVAKDRKKAMELFENAAAFGDSNAMARLGLCYESGIDCEKDEKKAFGYFVRSARQNNAIASYKAGLCYESGRGTGVDLARAFACFEKAANLGHVPSMWHTANYLSDGMGTEQNLWSAYKWYSKGAEFGDGRCYLQMAHFSFKGIGTVRNYTKAFTCYNKAYECGETDSDTALRIGVCHLRGLGTKENRSAALEWFKRAAAQGNADAMFLCGESYFFGSGCEQSYGRAVRYYASAVNEGHVRAIIELGLCYENGYGVEKNVKRAVSLYRRASEHDNAEANFKIAEVVFKTNGIITSERPLLFKSASKGYIPAILLMGILYDDGVGIPQNSDKAAEKYLEAITLGISKKRTLLFSMPERDAEKMKAVSEASVEATYRLGMLKGRHSKTVDEYTRAFEYLAGAAATGSGKAQAEIAKIYASGGDLHTYFHAVGEHGAPTQVSIADAMNKLGDTWYEGKPLLSKNDRAAIKCYRISAEMGQADAAYSLGWCLRHGVGTKVDDIEAAKWLKRSADKGNPYAAYSYGLCCEEGSGMEHPNLRDAVTYYRKAAAAGHADAKKRYLKIVERK